MCHSIFENASADPTVMCGSALAGIGSPYRAGKGEHFIFEACEYMDSFLDFNPTVAVILNMEMDHVDYFHSIEQMSSGQMVESLRIDPRVTVIENYNARYMSSGDFEYIPTLAVMDVSFISAKLIIPAVANVLSEGGSFVCLIKPQFEVGRGGLNKKGIVKSDALRTEARSDVIDFARCKGFDCLGIIESPITGGDGNIEYLAHFKRRNN